MGNLDLTSLAGANNSDLIVPFLVITVLATAGVLIYLLINSVRESNLLQKRIKELAKDAPVDTQTIYEEALIREDERTFEETVLRFLPTLQPLKTKFLQANLKITLSSYVLIIIVIGIVVSIAIEIDFLPEFGQPFLFVAIAHFIADKIVLNFLVAKTRAKQLALMPTAIDMIVRAVRVGQTINTAIRQVAEDLDEPLRSVFREIVDEMLLGTPLSTAIDSAAERLNIREFDLFATAIRVQMESGGNVAYSLNVLSETIRARHNLRMKIQALASEGKVSAIVVGALPICLFAYFQLTQPDYVEPLLTTEIGRVILAIAGVLMIAGIAWMIKLIRIKI